MDVGTRDEAEQKSIEVFCCYAREDQRLLLKLKTHLIPLQREGLITLWADVNINAGEEWEKEIDRHLSTARIILLLISPAFMASDYCYSVEMRRAMERHERGEARVIPIILRPVHWQSAPFGKLQALPADASPIIGGKWHHQDDAFYDVVEGIRDAVEALVTKNPAPQVHSPDQAEEEKRRLPEEAASTCRTEEGRQRGGVEEQVHQADEEYLHENERDTHAPLSISTAEARSGIHRSLHLLERWRTRYIIPLVGLVLLVIGGSTGFFIARNYQIASNNTPTTVAVQSTAAAQAQATADSIGLHNPYMGRLALNDPMRDNNQGNEWLETNSPEGSCQFSNDAYHVRANGRYIIPCPAQNTDFSNFTFQVEMTILKGDSGGIIFRYSDTARQWYYLQINQYGSYNLYAYSSNENADSLKSGSSSAFKKGLNQSNIVAVVAYNNVFYVYINQRYITSLVDKKFDHGQIGVANDSNPTSPTADIIFRNAMVWIL